MKTLEHAQSDARFESLNSKDPIFVVLVSIDGFNPTSTYVAMSETEFNVNKKHIPTGYESNPYTYSVVETIKQTAA